MEMEPVAYFQAIHKQMQFDELLATSPAVMEAMQEALPGLPVHLVPHAADPRVQPGWHDPAGPMVYAGGQGVRGKMEARDGRSCQANWAQHCVRS